MSFSMTRTLTSLPWLALFLLLTSCSERPSEVPEEPPPAPRGPDQPGLVTDLPEQARGRIRTDVVQEQLTPRSVAAPGEVSADLTRVAKVSSRIEGLIQEVFVTLGDRVTKDQPLISIGSLKLDELVQEFLVSRVHADLAQSNFDRTKKLREQKVVSERHYLEARAEYLTAKSELQHGREKLLNMGLSKKDLKELVEGSHAEAHRYVLRASLAGTIVEQKIVVGEGVLPGEELLEIIDTSRVWVFANLPVEQAGRFNVGDKGIIAAKGRPPVEAALSYIAPVADKSTLTVRIRFDVENRDGRLKPNEYVDVKLMEEAAPVLAIPLSALTLVEGVRGVFVQRDRGYAFISIELGQEGDGWVEVKKGLDPGEHVVVAGVFDLKNALLKEKIQGE